MPPWGQAVAGFVVKPESVKGIRMARKKGKKKVAKKKAKKKVVGRRISRKRGGAGTSSTGPRKA